MDWPIRIMLEGGYRLRRSGGGIEQIYRLEMVRGGSGSYSTRYRDFLEQHRNVRFLTGCETQMVKRGQGSCQLRVTSSGVSHEIECAHVVLATHANQALEVLGTCVTPEEQAILSKFEMQGGSAVIHQDPRWMPPDQTQWAGINRVLPAAERLHKWSDSLTTTRCNPCNLTDQTVFVTYSYGNELPIDGGVEGPKFEHLVLNARTVELRRQMKDIQGSHGVQFAGSYLAGIASHEDAVTSGLQAANRIMQGLHSYPIIPKWYELHAKGEWLEHPKVACTKNGNPRSDQASSAHQGRALSFEAVKAIVCSQVCARVASQSISADDSLQDIGLNSLKTAELAQSLGDELRMTVSPSVLYDYPTIASSATYLAAMLNEQADMSDQIHFQHWNQSLASLDLGAVHKAVERMVIDKVQESAGVTVGASDPLTDSGIDLLAAIKLRNLLQSELGAAAMLPSTLTLDYPTVAAVAHHITAQFAEAASFVGTLVGRLSGTSVSGDNVHLVLNDSLVAQEGSKRVHKVYGIAEAGLPTLPAAEATGLPTVASDGVETTASLPQMMTVLHKPDKLEQMELLPPLFMAAGGFGSSAAYYELARSLGGSRMVYGLDFEGSVPDALKQARIDAHSIQQVLPPGGKVHLGGLSSGGYTSFFTANLLQQAGFDVRCVFLIDPIDPCLFKITDRCTLVRDLFIGAGVLPEHLEEALDSPLEAFPAYPYLNRLFSAQRVHDYLEQEDLDVGSTLITPEPLVGNAQVVYFYTELTVVGEAKAESTEWAVEAPTHVTVSLPCNHARVLSHPEAFSIVASTMKDRMRSSECSSATELLSHQRTVPPPAQAGRSCPHSWSTGQVAAWVQTACPGCASWVHWIEQNNIDGCKLSKFVNDELGDLGAKQDFSYHFLKVRVKSLLGR